MTGMDALHTQFSLKVKPTENVLHISDICFPLNLTVERSVGQIGTDTKGT